MKNIKSKIIAFATLLLVASSCSSDFGDMNQPKDSVIEVNPGYFFSNMVQGYHDNYQRNINLYPDLYSQYWSNIVEGFGSPRYEYNDSWIGNQWNEFYTQHLTESIAIASQVGDDPNYTDAVAISDIYICLYWQRMSDLYGDLPYFGAGEGETVPYNTQEEIYYDLLERVTASVDAITGGEEQFNYGEYDRVYYGDVVKWQKLGNSLRLRLAMRLSNVDPTKAQEEVQAALSHEAGVLSSNDDVARIGQWSSGWYDYLDKMAWDWGNIRMSKTFSDYMYSQSTVGEDPRTPIWFTYKSDAVATTKEDLGLATYQGIENGLSLMPDDAADAYATMNVEGTYIDFIGQTDAGGDHSAYVPVMFYSEVLFLQAEAALRGWTSGSADDLYKQGIQASMDYVGVPADDATAYIAGVPSIAASDEASLKQLITQKWIANFPNGIESWSDFRRTDYPDLTLPADGSSANATVATGSYVKRIRYPDNQHNQNQVSMPSDRNTLATDRMDIKVWWDVADTNTKSNGLMGSNL